MPDLLEVQLPDGSDEVGICTVISWQARFATSVVLPEAVLQHAQAASVPAKRAPALVHYDRRVFDSNMSQLCKCGPQAHDIHMCSSQLPASSLCTFPNKEYAT